MKVKGLIKELEKMDKAGLGEIKVMLALDDEGNGYAELDEVDYVDYFVIDIPSYNEEENKVIILWPSHEQITIKENKMKIRIENGTEVMVNRITDYIANDGEQYSLAWDDAHGIAYRIVGRDASGAIWARDDN